MIWILRGKQDHCCHQNWPAEALETGMQLFQAALMGETRRVFNLKTDIFEQWFILLPSLHLGFWFILQKPASSAVSYLPEKRSESLSSEAISAVCPVTTGTISNVLPSYWREDKATNYYVSIKSDVHVYLLIKTTGYSSKPKSTSLNFHITAMSCIMSCKQQSIRGSCYIQPTKVRAHLTSTFL